MFIRTRVLSATASSPEVTSDR